MSLFLVSTAAVQKWKRKSAAGAGRRASKLPEEDEEGDNLEETEMMRERKERFRRSSIAKTGYVHPAIRVEPSSREGIYSMGYTRETQE